MLQQAFQAFSEKFPPANPQDATFKLTFNELHQIFARFLPTDFDSEELVKLMTDAGYTFLPENRSGTINFYWFLCEKK